MDTYPADGSGEGIAVLLRSLRPAAVIRDRHFDIVAANPAATRLSPGLATGENLLRTIFLEQYDEDCRFDSALFGLAVALLKDSLEQHEEDPRFATLIGELSALSAHFSQLWAETTTISAHTGVVATGFGRQIRFYELRPIGEFDLTVVMMSEDAYAPK